MYDGYNTLYQAFFFARSETFVLGFAAGETVTVAITAFVVVVVVALPVAAVAAGVLVFV